jgi:hypothetical protein
MRSQSEDYKINTDEQFTDGGFFEIDDAIRRITYSQDKSLVNLSFKKIKEIECITV